MTGCLRTTSQLTRKERSMKKTWTTAILVCIVLAVAAASAYAGQPGLTVKDGKLYRDGRLYRGIGVNYCDLFEELLSWPDSTRTLEGLRFLGEKKIPFLRFWCCGFGPNSWRTYFEDKTQYFRLMDSVIRTAEESKVGLIPSLFWCNGTVPALVREHKNQLGNPRSKTWDFMRTYIREVVTRYNDSPAIWGWECGNEWNLGFDLPNGMEFIGKKNPRRGFHLVPDERDLLTHQIGKVAYQTFGREIRKYDPYRFATTGGSSPRSAAYHFVNYPDDPWGLDNAEEAFEMFQLIYPDPNDVVSVHSYPGKPEYRKYAGVEGVAAMLAKYKEFAERINKPLFLGEFAAAAGQEIPMAEFRRLQKLYLDTILDRNIDLAAYWVFDYTPNRKGIGLVRRDNEYAWVIDQIVEYNEKIQQKLAAEAKP